MNLAELKNGLGDRQKVNAWLDAIGETDQACRDEILEACANGGEIEGVMVPAASFRRYYVGLLNSTAA